MKHCCICILSLSLLSEKFSYRLKKHQTNRIIIAWLLSLSMATPLITKTIHTYKSHSHNEACSHTENHSKHDCSTCLICLFTLPYFTESNPINPNTLFIVFGENLLIPYNENVYNSIKQFYQLRAPPLLS